MSDEDRRGRDADPSQEDREAKAPISVRESSAHLVPGGTTRPPPAPSREFTMDDEEWIARRVGQGYGGTGALSPGYLAAIRFYRADRPDRAVREALVARGRFESLYDEELRELFDRSVPIESDDDARP